MIKISCSSKTVFSFFFFLGKTFYLTSHLSICLDLSRWLSRSSLAFLIITYLKKIIVAKKSRDSFPAGDRVFYYHIG